MVLKTEWRLKWRDVRVTCLTECLTLVTLSGHVCHVCHSCQSLFSKLELDSTWNLLGQRVVADPESPRPEVEARRVPLRSEADELDMSETPPRPHLNKSISHRASSRKGILMYTHPETLLFQGTILPSISVNRPMKHPNTPYRALRRSGAGASFQQLVQSPETWETLPLLPLRPPATPATHVHPLYTNLSACNALSPSSVKPNVQTSLLTPLHASPRFPLPSRTFSPSPPAPPAPSLSFPPTHTLCTLRTTTRPPILDYS